MSDSGTKYFLIFLTVFFLSACSPEAGKNTLKFFFDGVPGDEVMELKGSNDSLNISDTLAIDSENPTAPLTVYHIPYLEKECATCHDQGAMGKYVMPQPRLCYQCHEIFEERYKVLHGPVGGGYCTACHHPHFTKEKSLLKRPGQELCLYCHAPGEGFNTIIHEGIENTNCTECHNPHGGEDKLMFN